MVKTFVPHGFCLLWEPSLLALHVIADGLIALAYYVIPALLIIVARKRADLPFPKLFWLFGAFILACGTTHAVGVYTVWVPAYWAAGGVKAATAVVSWVTAVWLAPLIPKALALASPAELTRLNRALQDEVQERCQAEVRLADALAHREILLREVHHRVKNNLQMVSSLMRLQSRYVTDPAVVEAFGASMRRVQAIAHLHSVLDPARGVVAVDCGRYLRQLVADLVQAYDTASRTIALTVEAAGVELAPEVALPCGLIVHELVANALTHAFPAGRTGSIRVRLVSQGATLRLSIADTGIGLPTGLSLLTAESLGFRLVRALTAQLGGALAVGVDAGTTVRVTFPAGA